VAAVSINEDVSTYIGEQSMNATLLGLLCSYDAEPSRTSEISAATEARFAGANDPAFVQVCAEMEIPSVFQPLSHPLDVDVPVFIAEGGLFAGGVHGWGKELASVLPDATVLTFPTRSSELAYAPPPCLRDLRNEFVVDPGPVEGGEDCVAQSEPIEFVGTG
jgi:hypothetical protein